MSGKSVIIGECWNVTAVRTAVQSLSHFHQRMPFSSHCVIADIFQGSELWSDLLGSKVAFWHDKGYGMWACRRFMHGEISQERCYGSDFLRRTELRDFDGNSRIYCKYILMSKIICRYSILQNSTELSFWWRKCANQNFKKIRRLVRYDTKNNTQEQYNFFSNSEHRAFLCSS